MATVYISPTGDDTRTYTQAQSSSTPWQTISKCNTSATTGDTIICLPGTYTWVSQTFTKGFTIDGQTYGSVIFDGANAHVRWRTADTTLIKNILFKNVLGTSGIYGIFDQFNANTFTTTFTTCTFKDLVWYGTGAFSSAWAQGNFTFNSCIFDDIHPSTNGSTEGMFMAQNEDKVFTFTLNNCTLYFKTSAANRLQKVFHDNVPNAGGDVVAIVKNCIFYNDTGAIIDLNTGCTFTYSYSDSYLMSTVPAGTANITSDPLFVDIANRNFRLRPTSPCLGTGTLV